MKETIFNTEVGKSLKRAGAWSYKIADSPTSWTMSRTRFTPEKPCDILFCIGGRFGAIEGKQMKKFSAFGLRDLRPSQIRHLDLILKAGGRAFVFLNVRIAGSRRSRQAYENRLLVLDWSVWRDHLEILSLSAKEVKSFPYIPGRAGFFDLAPFLSAVASGKDYYSL